VRSTTPRFTASIALAACSLAYASFARADGVIAVDPPVYSAPDAQVATSSSRAVVNAKPFGAEPRARGAIDQYRIDFASDYFRGTTLVGYGSRTAYQGGVLGLDLGLTHFFLSRLGVQVGLHFAALTSISAELPMSLDAALDVAPMRWRGSVPGSIVIGGGGAIASVYDKVSRGGDKARAAPFALARARIWTGADTMLQAEYIWTPISTSPLALSSHRAELSVGYGLLAFGARYEMALFQGGDPPRAFSEQRAGLFIGVGAY
jgi:hypothetical protein